MTKSFFIAILVLSYAAIIGCGTTGPLYIPEQRYPQEKPAEAPQNPSTSTEQFIKE